MVPLEITQEEVGKIIKHGLKLDVSPGFDKITPKDILENLDTPQPIETELLDMFIKRALVSVWGLASEANIKKCKSFKTGVLGLFQIVV